MTSLFTPKHILKKQRHQAIALFLVIIFTPTIFFQLSTAVTATESTVWDFTASPISLSPSTTERDTTIADFAQGNNTADYFKMTSLLGSGGITINQGFTYNTFTDPVLAGNSVNDTFLVGNLLYISVWGGGLHVINTQGTTDPSDDALVTRYHTGSTPALADNRVTDTSLNNTLLYISTNTGLSVINTQGTTNPSDDVLVTRYHTGSTPALVDNRVRGSFFSSNLLYVSTFGGLHVINTQGTTDPSDDVLVTRYHAGSSPAIGNNFLNHAFLENNLLYVSTGAGLSVINTQGTTDPSDDALVTRYHTGSTIPLEDNFINHTRLLNNLLYIATSGGLTVVDTKGTIDPLDDSLAAFYSIDTEPALADYYVYHTFLDNDFLYISTYDGLTVINTQGTTDQFDDVFVTRYHTGSTPGLPNNIINNAFFESNLLYISTSGGLSVITPNTYRPSGIYQSAPRFIATTPTTTLSILASTTPDHSVALSHRTGTNEAVWRDDFNTLDNYAGDFYGSGGGEFDWQTVVVENSILRASGEPLGNPNYSSFVITSGFLDSYFDAGSIITIKYRVLHAPGLGYINFYSNDDGAAFSKEYTILPNESDWKIETLIAADSFNNIGTDFYVDRGDIGSSVLEIDYVQVITPESMGQWGSWTSCATTTACALGNISSSTWLQYKIDLETDNTNTAPVVHEVSFNGPYQSPYTYTSTTETFATPRRFTTFTPITTAPPGTSITYEYSIDGGSTFNTFTPETFSSLNLEGTSFTWRTTLSTTNPAAAPTLTKVTLSHTDPAVSGTSTKVAGTADRIEALRDIESPAARDILLRDYPEYFSNPDSPRARQTASVILLREIVRLLGELVNMREGSGV